MTNDEDLAVIRLGPGPWPIYRCARGCVDGPNADPVYLYKDDLVGISPIRLHRTDAVADDTCWLKAPGWCLAYE